MVGPFVSSALLTCGLLIAAASIAISGQPPTAVALLLGLAFVPYAGLLLLRPPRSGQARHAAHPAALPLALVLAATAGLALVSAPSVLSDDVYRYRWDARVLLSGSDPYAHAPEAPALAALRDQEWSRINHRGIPTIYPPAAQLLFASSFALLESTLAFKLAALLLHLLSLVFMRQVMQARSAAPDVITRATYLLALNPLVLAETALGGHVDVAVGVCVLLLARSLQRPARGAAALWVGLASGLKLVGLVLVPLLLRRGLGTTVLALLLSLAAVAPLVRSGHADAETTSGIGHYAQRWRGNEGPFLLLERACRAGVDALADADATEGDTAEGDTARVAGPAEIELSWLAPTLSRLSGTPFDPTASLRAERKQPRPDGVLDRAHLAGLLARSLAAALVVGLSLWLSLRGADALLSVRSVLLAVLLLTPQLHPWYLLWLLPLEVALQRRTVLLWSAVALVAYAPLDGWLIARDWQEPALARPLQFGLVLCALVLEGWWLHGRAGPAPPPAPPPIEPLASKPRVDRSHLAV